MEWVGFVLTLICLLQPKAKKLEEVVQVEQEEVNEKVEPHEEVKTNEEPEVEEECLGTDEIRG